MGRCAPSLWHRFQRGFYSGSECRFGACGPAVFHAGAPPIRIRTRRRRKGPPQERRGAGGAAPPPAKSLAIALRLWAAAARAARSGSGGVQGGQRHPLAKSLAIALRLWAAAARAARSGCLAGPAQRQRRPRAYPATRQPGNPAPRHPGTPAPQYVPSKVLHVHSTPGSHTNNPVLKSDCADHKEEDCADRKEDCA